MKEKNIIQEKTYQFALSIVKLYIRIQEQKEYVLSKQLLRAGTSIGANTEEASAAQTKKDFIAKMAIASKEARESHYWLRLYRDSELCTGIDFAPIITDSEEIIRIITAIVKTSQSNLKP